jgi:hypothetical protein
MLSFCGIDVSKDRLDVMVLLEEQCCSVPNDAGGWAALVERGTVRTTKLKEGWYFNSPVTSLASLIVFNTPSGSRAPARTSSSTNRSLPNRLPIANRFLSRSSNPLGVHKLVAQKPDDGADQSLSPPPSRITMRGMIRSLGLSYGRAPACARARVMGERK